MFYTSFLNNCSQGNTTGTYFSSKLGLRLGPKVRFVSILVWLTKSALIMSGKIGIGNMFPIPDILSGIVESGVVESGVGFNGQRCHISKSAGVSFGDHSISMYHIQFQI